MLIDEGDEEPTVVPEGAEEALLDMAEDDPPAPQPQQPPVNGRAQAIQFFDGVRAAAAGQIYGVSALLKDVDAVLVQLYEQPELASKFLHARAALGSAYSAYGSILSTLRPV